MNIAQIPLQQQRVTDPHHQRVQMGTDILVAPVRRQHIDAIAPPQAQRAQRTPDHLAARCDQYLHGRGFHRRDLIDPLELPVFLQAQQFGHAGAQHHPVADLQDHRLEIAAQRKIAAQHVDQSHAFAFEQAHTQHLAADQVAVGGNHHLGKELHV